MTITETQKTIVAEFKKDKDWFDRRRHLIQIGKAAPVCLRARASDGNLIRGCQVSTWFFSEFKEGKMYYEIDSDSAVVKGIAVLLARIFSGQTPQDIAISEIDIIAGIGLEDDFSPIRANSLLKIAGRITADAAAHIGQVN